jgi:hypothetical protein
MELEELQEGMTVLVTEWDDGEEEVLELIRPGHWNEDGDMDEWQGETVMIDHLTNDGAVYISGDDVGWTFKPSDFEPAVVLPNNDPNRLFNRYKHDKFMTELRGQILKRGRDVKK